MVECPILMRTESTNFGPRFHPFWVRKWPVGSEVRSHLSTFVAQLKFAISKIFSKYKNFTPPIQHPSSLSQISQWATTCCFRKPSSLIQRHDLSAQKASFRNGERGRGNFTLLIFQPNDAFIVYAHIFPQTPCPILCADGIGSKRQVESECGQKRRKIIRT